MEIFVLFVRNESHYNPSVISQYLNAFKDPVEVTTDLTRNARRVKHTDRRTLISKESEDKISSHTPR